jgi:hypothetical protein
MSTVVRLDPRKWMEEKFGIYLQDKTVSCVANFVILWNLFEKEHCEKQACIEKFKGVSIQINDKQPLPEALAAALNFWSARYINDGKSNCLFDELFAREDGKAVVEHVLKETNCGSQQQLLALLIIVYRLRNNLFHGEKALWTLDAQRENFEQALTTLVGAMDLIRGN